MDGASPKADGGPPKAVKSLLQSILRDFSPFGSFRARIGCNPGIGRPVWSAGGLVALRLVSRPTLACQTFGRGAESETVKGIRINFYQITAFAIAMCLGPTMAANGQPASDTNIFPLLSQTNSIAANLPANDTNEVRPYIIYLQDMPISQAIEALARNAGINYLVDTRLCDWWLLPNSDATPLTNLLSHFVRQI